MRPVLVEIPFLGIAVPAYGAFVLIAAIVGIWIGPRWIERQEGLDRSRARWALLALAVVLLVGGRLHFLATNWELFQDAPWNVLKLGAGAVHAAGFAMALALGAFVILPRFGLPIGRFLDGLSPTVGIFVALRRVGCFLHGCCFGKVSDLPWAVTFPKSAYVYHYHASLGLIGEGAVRSAPVQPLQLYFAAAGLLITLAALWVYPRKRYDGQVALVALLVFGIGSAVLEFFRAEYYPRLYWGPLPRLEWMALAMVVVAGTALAVMQLRKGRGRSSAQPDLA